MINSSQHQLGIFSWFGWVLPLPDRVKLIKKAGFGATTLWWEDEIGSPVIKKERMPDMVRDAGLIVENIHIPYDDCDDLWSEHKPTRDAIVNKYIHWLNDCAEYYIPIMVMHITNFSGLPTPDQNGKYGLDSIGRLLKAAEDLGIMIALENTDREDYIHYVLSEIHSDYLGFCYDSSHNRRYGHNTLDLLRKRANRITSTHLSDNDGIEDRHWLPGEGIIDWNQLADLFPSNYTGCFTLEVCPTEQELRQTPESFLSQAYKSALWLKKLCYK